MEKYIIGIRVNGIYTEFKRRNYREIDQLIGSVAVASGKKCNPRVLRTPNGRDISGLTNILAEIGSEREVCDIIGRES